MRISDTCRIRTCAGGPIGLAGRRLNHSAKVADAFLNFVNQMEHNLPKHA